MTSAAEPAAGMMRRLWALIGLREASKRRLLAYGLAAAAVVLEPSVAMQLLESNPVQD